MKVSAFDFELPRELIAQAPVRPRDAARLLHIDTELRDLAVTDLPKLFTAGDMLIFNDTKVIPSRLTGKRLTARIEVTLHKQVSESTWWAFARPGRRLKMGDTIEFSSTFSAQVMEKTEDGNTLLSFECEETDVISALAKYGLMPLPPYIRRPPEGIPRDLNDYQTLFALNEGAVAAPTAGLHFTEGLLSGLAARGVLMTFVTLHVGAGTFLPVKASDTNDHRMHSEWGNIKPSVAYDINRVRRAGGRIIPVGSTSLRLLEAAADTSGTVSAFSGETDIFISPGYKFRVADKMITNFHLPKSTLFMLVSAFAGLSRMKKAYTHAVNQQYRFFSYGDACLLEREAD